MKDDLSQHVVPSDILTQNKEPGRLLKLVDVIELVPAELSG